MVVQHLLCRPSHIHSLDVSDPGEDAIPPVSGATHIGEESAVCLPQGQSAVHQATKTIIKL